MSEQRKWLPVLVSGLIGSLIGGAASLGGTMITTSNAQDQSQHDYQRERRVDGYLALTDALSELQRVVDYQTPLLTGAIPRVKPLDFVLDERARTELWEASRKTTAAYARTLVFPSGSERLKVIAHELTIYFGDASSRLDVVDKTAAEIRAGKRDPGDIDEAVRRLDARFNYVGICGVGGSEKCASDDLAGIPELDRIGLRKERDPINMVITMRQEIQAETS